jgi:4-aminobutyrate aminotransferase-like enzyme
MESVSWNRARRNIGEGVGRAVTRIVGDVRGLGLIIGIGLIVGIELMIGIELVGDQGTKEKAAARSANRVRARA